MAAPVQTKDRLKVKVFSPYETFFEGSAVSLSATNKTGPFDILYRHSNFFSTLIPGQIKVDTGFDVIRIEVSNGIICISNNTVVVFANV